MPHRTDLLGLSVGQLHETLEPVIDRPFRVKQIFAALHHRRVVDFSQITELSLDLRSRLDQDFRIGLPAVTEARTSSDGTVKVLFEMTDGASIEAVDIPDGRRRTFCISSQAGCPLACQFCVTGYWGAGRDLTVGEIVGQVYRLRGHRDSRLLEGNQGAESLADETNPDGPKEGKEKDLGGINLVFMGMGEPLLNASSVRQAIELLSETISLRRMTLSTVGILPALEEMMDWPSRPNLAISLHAPDDERRSKIMPVNRSNPLRDLMALLRKYPQDKSRKITFEYVMIRDFNDQLEAADATAQLLRGLHAKVNLIPINPDPVLGSRMVPPPLQTVQAFKDRLRNRGVFATVRKQRGDAVSGACGQLRAFARAPRGFRTPVNL
ncbi:MAG: 23S rRNA (adenine(2503)-C(2))-methyltransferase RlmN [Deltaproteobacteria bacterium]|nr:23S rRNA (adenine(2503)-C(2))-methyltransferase RlmN [Deltaproteobacteria bacterium]